jgi:hypothetical protein
VTYTDPHPIQLEQQESDSTVEDITPSSSIDETPPLNTDSSVGKSKRTNAGLDLSSHEHLVCLQQQISEK